MTFIWQFFYYVMMIFNGETLILMINNWFHFFNSERLFSNRVAMLENLSLSDAISSFFVRVRLWRFLWVGAVPSYIFFRNPSMLPVATTEPFLAYKSPNFSLLFNILWTLSPTPEESPVPLDCFGNPKEVRFTSSESDPLLLVSLDPLFPNFIWPIFGWNPFFADSSPVLRERALGGFLSYTTLLMSLWIHS